MTYVRWALLAFLTTLPAGEILARQWRDSTGAFQVEAELVSVKGEKVYLEKSNGEILAVPLARLSVEDLHYLASLPEYRGYFETHPIPGVEPAEAGVPGKEDADATAGAPAAAEETEKAGEVHRFEDLRWGVKSLAFSPDGRLLAAGKPDREILVFDLDKKQRVASAADLEGLGQVTALSFSPDGRMLLSGGYTGRIQVWEIGPGGGLAEAHRLVGHSGAVQTITVSRDGSRVLSGGDDKTLRGWTLNDGRQQFAVDGFAGAVKATFISRGGKQGLGCDGDVIVLVDMQEGKAIQTMKLGKRSAQAVAIAPDGSLVAAQDTYAIQAWEIRSGGGRPLFQDREIQWSAAFLPNAKFLLSGGRGKVNVWDATAHRKIYEFDMAETGYVQTLACSPDNCHFAAIASRDLQVFRLPAEVAAP